MLMKTETRKAIPRFSRDNCTACIMCVDVCPKGALDTKVMNSNTGFRRFPYLKQEDICIGCRLCEKECPVESIQMIAH